MAPIQERYDKVIYLLSEIRLLEKKQSKRGYLTRDEKDKMYRLQRQADAIIEGEAKKPETKQNQLFS